MSDDSKVVSVSASVREDISSFEARLIGGVDSCFYAFSFIRQYELVLHADHIVLIKDCEDSEHGSDEFDGRCFDG